MKKFTISILLVLTSLSGCAQGGYRGGVYYNQYNHNYGTGAAIAGGIIGGVIIGNMLRPPVYVQPYPQVIVSPVYTQSYSIDPCSTHTEYNGAYNPQAAQAYCRGVQSLMRQQQNQLNAEAYQRGVNGQ